MKRIDRTTKLWIRNRSDELAAANGCKFDPERAAYAVWWIERYCRLYEGDQSGEPLRLRSCDAVDAQFPIITHGAWEEAKEEAIARVWAYAEARGDGLHCDWQYECITRIFGWMKFSERWARPIRRFRRGSVWVAKKNKKSPTLAAVALHLTIGDGELGQKVFLGAKDGKQVKLNACKHAIEMVRASEELASECDINEGEGRIVHGPTRSLLAPLTSGQENNAKAKEGLNGSLIIDECHVVDRAFIKRVSRMGISRSEPLQLEFSTAGFDPMSYGKEAHDYGARVVLGDQPGGKVDERYFYAAYEAPQDLSDEDLAADPLKYARMANPAWGHTIDPAEVLDDYNTSKETITGLTEFRVYRLNIWATAAATWLRTSAWAACYESYTAEDLRGRRCYAGFDLAQVLDFTALVCCFPDEDEEELFRQLAWFWLPEQTARERAEKAPYLDWAKDGYIKLTPGDVCDYETITADVGAILDQFDSVELAFDPWNAEATTQRLAQDYGVRRLEFPQTMTRLTEGTKAYERLVRAGRLRHNGHPVLTWQAGHVKVKSDYSGNIRPIKPEHGDHRTIDGIIGGVMGLDRAMKAPPPAKGSLFIF